MHTNNMFSFKRFIALFKQSLIINKKTIAISIAGISGTLFVLLMVFQKLDNFEYWTNENYFSVFLVFFFSLGIIYSSLSFPAFRSKEKSITYLTLPISASEKFIFELLTRIVLFILFMPMLFWVIANIEGRIVHYYIPEFINYKFSFSQALTEINNNQPISIWSKLFVVQSGLFVFIAVFTGACYFRRLPLIKTLFAFSTIVIAYLLFIYLIFKGLNLKDYRPSEQVFFIKNQDDIIALWALGLTVVNIVLIAVAWFRLKEKEVL